MRLYSEVFTVLFIGHSLIAHDIPAMVESLGRTGSTQVETDVQIINGAPLKYNWENSAQAEGVDARRALRSTHYDALVMTEAVPLRNHLQWSDSKGYAERFADLAWSQDLGTQVFIYETWHSLKSGTGQAVEWDEEDHIPWRTRIDNDLPNWQSIVTAVNANRPSGAAPARLVPAGQAFGQLYDEIDQGRVPYVRSIQDFFDDDIHTNDLGDYFVALVHYAVLSGGDTTTLPFRVTASWDRMVRVPPDLARALQRIALESVRASAG